MKMIKRIKRIPLWNILPISLLSLLLSSIAPGYACANNNPLLLGFFPYVSPEKLLAHQKVLIDYLSQALSRPIAIVSAKNMATYIQNVRGRQYDIIYSAPHLARYSEINNDYKRIVMTDHSIQGFYLVLKDSPYTELNSLKGKVLAMVPRFAIMTQVSMEELAEYGLWNGKNITIKYVSSHNNAIYSVLNRESDAGLTGLKLYLRLPAEQKQKLRVLEASRELPGFIIMGKADLSDEMIELLKSVFMGFNRTVARENYLFNGFRPIEEYTMRHLDPYISVFNKIE